MACSNHKLSIEAGLQVSRYSKPSGRQRTELKLKLRGESVSTRVEVSADAYKAFEEIELRGWGDGLPIIPPTEELVDAFVTASSRSGSEVLAVLAPTWAEATVEKVAINAVMAGCRPEYMPVICAGVRAIADEPFNLYAIQTTTHPCAVLLIVSGPISTTLQMNSGYGAFGPGNRANASIGRAMRLVLMNIAGAKPGVLDRATQGGPAKYTFCVAENEKASPWPSFRESLGFKSTDSLVTVVAGESPHNINDHGSTSADGLLRQIAGTMATPSNNNTYMKGDSYLFIGPEHARLLADGGLSREDVQRYLFDHATVPFDRFSAGQLEHISGGFGSAQKAVANEAIHLGVSSDDIKVLVVGGDGRHSCWVPTFGMSKSCSEVA